MKTLEIRLARIQEKDFRTSHNKLTKCRLKCRFGGGDGVVEVGDRGTGLKTLWKSDPFGLIFSVSVYLFSTSR